MKSLMSLLLISGLLLLNVSNGSATTHGIKPDYRSNWSELEKIQKNKPGLDLLKGEIIEINAIEILMTSVIGNNEVYRLKLIPSTKFYCNGIDSQWESLLPVAPGAYFEAGVLVNDQMEALAVSAFYFGEECIVKRCYQSQGKFVMELISVITEENYVYPVSESARLPREDNWKQEGQVVYILYNGLDEIRAVFLPD